MNDSSKSQNSRPIWGAPARGSISRAQRPCGTTPQPIVDPTMNDQSKIAVPPSHRTPFHEPGEIDIRNVNWAGPRALYRKEDWLCMTEIGQAYGRERECR